MRARPRFPLICDPPRLPPQSPGCDGRVGASCLAETGVFLCPRLVTGAAFPDRFENCEGFWRGGESESELESSDSLGVHSESLSSTPPVRLLGPPSL